MRTMRNWMLGAAVVASGLGMGATAAQAAEFGIYARGPAAYVPPCPGPGYVWTAGYMADGYWVPGQWEFIGYGGYGGYGDDDRFEHFDRGEHRDWDRGRGFDRRSGEDWGRGWRGDDGDRGWGRR